MSEFDALQYKKALVEEDKSEISEEQAIRLMYDPARSRDEIDAVVEGYREEFAAQQEAERARFEAERDTGSS